MKPGIEISSSSIIFLGSNAVSWLVRLSITVLLHQCENRRSSSQYPAPLRQLRNCHASTHVLINDIHITLMVRRDIICSISIPAVSPHARPRAVLTDCCLRQAGCSAHKWAPDHNIWIHLVRRARCSLVSSVLFKFYFKFLWRIFPDLTWSNPSACPV